MIWFALSLVLWLGFLGFLASGRELKFGAWILRIERVEVIAEAPLPPVGELIDEPRVHEEFDKIRASIPVDDDELRRAKPAGPVRLIDFTNHV